MTESIGFSNDARELLESRADVEWGDLDADGLRDRLGPDVDVLWVRLRHHIDRAVLRRAPNLRFIVTATTGLNHIDLDAARDRGVTVVSLRGETEFLRNIRATAEHTIGLMLALLRDVPRATVAVRDGRWERDAHKGRELYEKTVGLVGFGRIGRLVARYLEAFDARVLAHDIAPLDDVPPHVQSVELPELLATADIVSLHASHRPGDPCIIGPAQLRLMRPGTWLVNTARGELLDELALVEALEEGRLAGAALDVLADETRTSADTHPLMMLARRSPTLMITPHIGGCTHESMAKTERFLVVKLLDELDRAHLR
jgi:D-3-phosphoglycerate dehydrogenase